jgi:hypothetical protein
MWVTWFKYETEDITENNRPGHLEGTDYSEDSIKNELKTVVIGFDKDMKWRKCLPKW